MTTLGTGGNMRGGGNVKGRQRDVVCLHVSCFCPVLLDVDVVGAVVGWQLADLFTGIGIFEVDFVAVAHPDCFSHLKASPISLEVLESLFGVVSVVVVVGMWVALVLAPAKSGEQTVFHRVMVLALQHWVAAMMLAYSVVTVASLRLVMCMEALSESGDWQLVLRSYPSVVCYEGLHAFAGPLAWLALVVFCVGFPAIAFVSTAPLVSGAAPSSSSFGGWSTGESNSKGRPGVAELVSQSIVRSRYGAQRSRSGVDGGDGHGGDGGSNVTDVSAGSGDPASPSGPCSSPSSPVASSTPGSLMTEQRVKPRMLQRAGSTLQSFRMTLQRPPPPLAIALGKQVCSVGVGVSWACS